VAEGQPEHEVTAGVRACWEPHARALLAFERGDRDASILVIDDLGDTEALPASWFFRDEGRFPPLERRALELCEGRVLDLGAGAGCHALVLQERGHPVCAVEILPELVELLQRREVTDARTGSVFTPPAGRWDPGGRIIADSTDMRRFATGWRSEGGIRLALREDGRYVGEIQFQLEFAGRRGDPFSQLYVDPDTLSDLARRAGWEVEIVDQGENGAFLSRLRRSGGRAVSGVPSDAPQMRG